MFDKNDISLLKNMFAQLESKMDKRFAGFNARTDKLIAKMQADTDKRLKESDAMNNERIIQSESFLLDEIARMQRISDEKFSAVCEKLDELKQYYHIAKLDSDTITILLRSVSDLQKRVEILEHR